MMRVVLLGLPRWSGAVDAQEAATHERPLSVGICGSGDLGYRQLEVQEPNPMMDGLTGLRNDTEAPGWGYSAGMEVAHSLKGRWSFSLGLRCSNRSYGNEDILLTDILGADRGHVTVNFQYTFASIPTMARYGIDRGAFRFKPGLGKSYYQTLEKSQIEEIRYADDRTEARESHDLSSTYRDHLATGIAALGMSIRTMEWMEIQFMLRGRNQLTTLMDAPMSANLSGTGPAPDAAVRC